MEHILSKTGITIAIIVSHNSFIDGFNFVSQPEDPLQFGVNIYKKNHKIPPHNHIKRVISLDNFQEVVHIDHGKVIVTLYDLDDSFIKKVELASGDTIIFQDGGHGLDILDDTKIIEVKQGPYPGKNKDKRMI